LNSTIRSLGHKSKVLIARADKSVSKFNDLSKEVCSQIDFLKDHASSTIKTQYNNNSSGNSFLKSFSCFTKSSRTEQINNLQTAIDGFKHGVVQIVLDDPVKFIERPEAMLLELPGKDLSTTLQKEIGKILINIDKEKTSTPYKLGSSRLEQLCTNMCNNLGVTVEDVKKIAASHEEITPDIKKNKPTV